MRINELIDELEKVKEKHGNLMVSANVKGPEHAPYGWILTLYGDKRRHTIDL